jgi:diguanylate cyclase (GGDEF)-like protein/PAS domain S-box-containing protein
MRLPTPETTRESSTDLSAVVDLRVRHCEMLKESGKLAMAASLGIALVLTLSLRGAIPDRWQVAWLLGLATVSLARLAVSRRFDLRTGDDGAAAARFQWQYRILVLISGMLWGLTPLLLAPGADLNHELVLFFALAGITAGGMTTLAIDGWSVRAFMLPCMIPMILRFVSHVDPLSRALAFMGFMFIGFMAANTRRVARGLNDNLRLELEAEGRERVLRESEDRLKRAQKVAKLGSFEWDLQTAAVRWSDEHFRLWGLEPGAEAPSVRLFSERVHPDDRVRVREAVAEAIRKRRGYECTHRVCWPDGSVHHVQERAEVVKDEAGRVIRIIGTVQDVSTRRAAEDTMRTLAYYDTLTGLPNRNLLRERMQEALAAAAEGRGGGAVLLIDLDHFKNLNDTLGHEQGDLLLKLVAQRLQACVRSGDTVARPGGDEFVVLLTGLGSESPQILNSAARIAEQILATLQGAYPLRARDYHIASSIGVTLFRDLSEPSDELLKRAELAMYQAKAAGRNSLRFFTPQMQARASERSALEADLREANQLGQLELHYQGQVDAQGSWQGAEALLRWRHHARGFVSPDDFIPIAEESGLILPIGLWVLEQACATLVNWSRRPGLAHLTLSVNVSARQFRQARFVEEVLEVLRRTGADPHRLKLELTESMLLTDMEDIIRKMTALRDRGVGFALDDFGIGFSALSSLKRLPLVQLKIDKMFVKDVLDDSNDAAIVAMILALGHSLDLDVVAEGVETEGQRDFLARRGCEAYQGYLFCRPLPRAEFEARLLAGRISPLAPGAPALSPPVRFGDPVPAR